MPTITSPTIASLRRDGGEFLVNTSTIGGQTVPSITHLADGGFVVVWTDASSSGGDASLTSIKAQRFDAGGSAVGDELLVNTSTDGEQDKPAVSALADGGFIVAWHDFGVPNGDIKARSFAANGAPQGSEITVNAGESAQASQRWPTIAVLANGNYVIAWEDWNLDYDPTGKRDIVGQMFASDGSTIGERFRLNPIDGLDQANPKLAALANGGFVATWQVSSATAGQSDFGNMNVNAQVFDASGAKVGDAFAVGADTAVDQADANVTSLANGGFAIAWTETTGTETNWSSNVRAQIYSANGQTAGVELAVAAQGGINEWAEGIAPLANGGFVVSWKDGSYLDGDTSQHAVGARAYSADGTALGHAVRVNTATANDQHISSLATLANGQIVAVWQDESLTGGDGSVGSIKAQIFDAGLTFTQGQTVYSDASQITDADGISGPDTAGRITWYWQRSADNGATWTDIGASGSTIAEGSAGQYKLTQLDVGKLVRSVTTYTDLAGNIETVYSAASTPVVNVNDPVSGVLRIVSQSPRQLTTSDLTDTSSQFLWTQAEGGNGHIYEYVEVQTGSISPLDASSQAANKVVGGVNGYLVTLTTAQEDAAVWQHLSSKMPTSGGTLLGASDATVEGQWRWIGGPEAGQLVGYTNWANGEPNNGLGGQNYLNYFPVSWWPGWGGKWDDAWTSTSVSGLRGFIIEYSADPAPAATQSDFMEGRTLYADASQITEPDGVGAITWQWQRSADNGATWADISGATEASYTLAQADVGKLVRSEASYTDNGGTQETVYSAASTAVADGNAAPSITSNGGGATATAAIAENSTAITTVTASDPDPGTTLAYSISGGADAALFQINAATGALSFKTAPNFEAPADAGANNVYDVTVQVSDGSLTDTQALAVTITNVIEGTAASESLAGGAGDDIITASGGDDNLSSNAGNDRLYGEAGNDYLRGGYGNDLFDGGDGIDRVSFYAFNPSDPQVGVTLDLALEGIAQDTGHGFDTLIGIEQASGTIFADLIRGNALDNVLSGNSGDDSLEGRAGNDLLEGGPGTNVLDGGIGNDTATYLSAENAVLASLASGNSSGGDGVDTLISIENLTGSYFDDELTGNAGDNILAGSFGADKLDGGNGNDLLLGDGAIRKLIVRGSGGPAEIIQDDGADASGVAGNDILIGGGGNDTLVGGVGNDTAVYDGAISDYTLLANSDGSTTIVDNRSSGSNGTDTLTGIEFLSFGGILYGIDGVPVNLSPAISSNGGGATAAVSIAENGRPVTTVTATDPDAGTTLAYSISGGADAARFQIDASTGALSFKTAPNFEAPTDAGANNVYDVTVQVSDGSLTDTQALAVTVTNANEQPSGRVAITGTATVGSALSASHTVVDPDGPGSGGYQWTRNGADITGATGANYTLTNADAGQAIAVKLTYTDGGGFRQSVASTGLTVSGLNPAVRIQGSDFTTGEDGGTAVFSISLTTAPVDPVTITFSVSDASEGSIATNVLTFTSANWNVAQTLTVTGVDDYLNDANVAYDLQAVISTRDLSYQRVTIASIALSNTDDGQDAPVYLYGDNGINYLTGLNGNDRLYGGGNLDELRGGRGNDRLYGQEDNDRLYGELGNDDLYGGYDDDELHGGDGKDRLYGEGGEDRLEGAAGDDLLDGGIGADTMIGGAGNDTYYVDDLGDVIDDQGASTDVDTVLVLATIQYTLAANVDNAALGQDSGDAGLTGNTLNNDLTGNAGRNALAGGSGSDVLDGGAGNDVLNGGSGRDVLVGGAGNDKISGGTGTDTADFSDAQGNVTVDLTTNRATGDGTDTLSSIENVIVGSGDDLITGNAGANTLNGGVGNDNLTGGAGGDVLVGGSGNDTLYAGDGDDAVNAGSGNDIIVGGDGAGNDRYNGGTGVDTVKYTSAKAGITVNLAAASDQAKSTAAGDAAGIGIDQLSAIENVIAGNFNDKITGDSAANSLFGMKGNDLLSGGSGNDKLFGGAGADTLIGGTGADRFIFDTAPTSRDTIRDFSRAQGDKIQLSKAVFKGFAYTGLLDADDFYAAAGATKAQDAADRIIYNTATGVLYYDSDGLGGAAAVQVALLGTATHPSLTFSDLQIIA